MAISQISILNNAVNIPEREVEGQGFGHSFKIKLEAVGKKLKAFFIYTFHSLGEVFSRRSPLGKVCKFTISVLTGIAHKAGQAFSGAGLLKVLGIVDGFLDGCDLIADTDGIVNDRNRENGKMNKWSLMANISLLVADIMGLVLWLDELAFISLTKVSACIGKGFSKLAAALGPGFARFTAAVTKACPILAKVAARVTFVNVLRGIVAGAFCLLVVNEARKFYIGIRERNIQMIVNSALYIASYVAEIALKILVIVGMTNVPGLVVIGCLAAGFGLAAIIMEVVRDLRKKRAAEEQVLQQQPVEQPRIPPQQPQLLKAAA